MKSNTILSIAFIFAMILVGAVGCGDTSLKSEKIEKSFFVMMEFPYIDKEFTEGHPKDIKAIAYLGEKELKRNVTFIWNSDIDGDIAEGSVMSTEHFSIGEHVLTLTAYYKNDRTANETAEIQKVNRPHRKDVAQEILVPLKVIDRVDGTVYMDNQDGTVTDTHTRLMWEQADDGYRRSVYEAYEYCEELDLAGRTDWRIPSISELEEIANINVHKKEPFICQVFDTKTSAYWSQTQSSFTLSMHPDRNFYHSVEFVYSSNRNGLHGKSISVADEYSLRYVRCVR
jgi:hypothetical protein